MDEDIPLSIVKLANDLFECDFGELVEIDNEQSACDMNVEEDWLTY